MTQDSDRQSSSSSKRSTRAGRSRPVLVTSQEVEGTEQASIEEATPTVDTVEESIPESAPPKRRMPAFFSTIGKRAPTEESQEIDPAQARIARATRGKAAPAKASSEEKKPEVKKEPAGRSAASSKPASPFKTKYLIGIGVYLLAANFIGIFETQYIRAYGLEKVLTQFTLFGSKIVISTSTLVFLATLVIILVALARFDLIPRNFSAIMGGQQNTRGSGSSSSSKNQGSNEGSRNIPPTMKQGVKGADDDLYQEYRSNQKRTKKK